MKAGLKPLQRNPLQRFHTPHPFRLLDAGHYLAIAYPGKYYGPNAFQRDVRVLTYRHDTIWGYFWLCARLDVVFFLRIMLKERKAPFLRVRSRLLRWRFSDAATLDEPQLTNGSILGGSNGQRSGNYPTHYHDVRL